MMKTTLENQIKVVGKEKKDAATKPILEYDLPKEEVSCDCRMDGMLFIRGKSGCKKTKDEHKF